MVDLTLADGGHIARRQLIGLAVDVKPPGSGVDEPDVAGSDVIVGGRRIAWTVGDVVGSQVGEAEDVLGHQVDASAAVPSRIEAGQVIRPDNMLHTANLTTLDVDRKRLQRRARGSRIRVMPVVDVHAHAIPPAFADYLVRKGASVGVAIDAAEGGATRIIFGDRVTAPLRADMGDLETRLSWMDGAGIDQQVMAGWIDLTGYELDAAHAVDYSRAHNDCLADHAADHADRFHLLGTVPLQAPAEAAAELERLMGDGFIGIEIATSVRGQALDLAGLDAVWEVAADTGAFILLHPMTPLGGVDLGRHFMENSIGRPAETSITLGGLILSGVFERHPDLRLCAVHGGGFTPFQIGRLDRSFHAKPGLAGAHISRPPSEYLRQLYVDTVVHDPAVLRFVIDYLGVDQVLLGTDYPFEMGDLDPMATLRAVPDITAAEIDAIAGATMTTLQPH